MVLREKNGKKKIKQQKTTTKHKKQTQKNFKR